MKCPNCGSENEEGMKFCGECGTPIPQEKKCPVCGASVPAKMKFCGECGAKMDGSSAGGGGSGISMGDKNVIAGDVIGKKESYNVSGNATIVHNQDESRKVLQCAVCGKHLLNSEAIECNKCARVVCKAHFNAQKNCCSDCAGKSLESAAEQYNAKLKEVYADGRVEFSERKELNALAAQLGISKTEADNLEAKFVSSSAGGDGLLPHEKQALEEAEQLLVQEEYDAVSEKLKPLEKRLGNLENLNEQYISLELRCLMKINPREALSEISLINADFEASLEADAVIHIDLGDFAKAKAAVDKFLRIYPQSVVAKCVNVFYLNRLYAQDNSDSALSELKAAAEQLAEGATPYEKKLVTQAKWQEQNPGRILCRYKNIPMAVFFCGNTKAFFVANEESGNGILEMIKRALVNRRKMFKSNAMPTLSLDLSAATETVGNGNGKFYDVEFLAYPKGVKEIPQIDCGGCLALKKVILSPTVKTIGFGAFSGCKSLESVIIPEGVESIEMAAFTDCSSLKSLKLPDSIKSIGVGAFGSMFGGAYNFEVIASESVKKLLNNPFGQMFKFN